MSWSAKKIDPHLLKVIVRNQGTRHMIRNVFKPFFGPYWDDYKKLNCKGLVLELERRIQTATATALEGLSREAEKGNGLTFLSAYEKVVTRSQLESKLRKIQACRPYSDYSIQMNAEFEEANKLQPCENSNLCPWCFARALEKFIAELKTWDAKDIYVQSYVFKFPLAKECMRWELMDPKKAFKRLIQNSSTTNVGGYIVTQDWFNTFTDMDRVKDPTHYRPRKVLFHTFTRGEHEVKDLMEIGDLKTIYAPAGSKRYAHQYVDKLELDEIIPGVIQFGAANIYENWPTHLIEFLGLYHDYSSFEFVTSQKYNA